MSLKLYLLVVLLSTISIQSVAADEKQHRKLAEEYLELSGYRKQLTTLNEQSAELYAATNPDFKDYQKAILRAFQRVYSFEKIKPELVQLLSKHFTEDELAEMVKFFKTPVGKKLTEKSPEIAKSYVELFRKLSADEALNNAIQEEIAKGK